MTTSRTYSHTALKQAQRCLRKWYYRYIRRLEPVVPKAHLERGKGLHDALEEAYTTGALDPGKYSDEDVEVIDRYFEYYKGDPAWEVIAAEQEYTMEVGDFEVVFKPDMVVRINGEIWCVDHKTTTRIPDETDSYNMTDFQHLLYLEGLRQNGLEARGFIFNYIRTKPPTQPKLRKDGKIADVRRIDTDYQTLLLFAEETGNDGDPDVIDKLHILRHTPNKFFQRHFLLANETAIRSAVQDTRIALRHLATAEEMEQYPRHVLSGGTGWAACASCEFQPLCFSEMMGMNTDLELLGYRERERRSE